MNVNRPLLRSTLITILLAISAAACGSGSSCKKVAIPTLSLKCSKTAQPCSVGAGAFSVASDPYYALGAFIVTGSSCNSSTMQSSKASANGFAILSQATDVFDGTDTYTLQVGTSSAGYVDSKGASVTQLCSGTYTVCAYFESVTGGSSISYTYYQKVGSFDLSSPSTTTIGPTGWILL